MHSIFLVLFLGIFVVGPIVTTVCLFRWLSGWEESKQPEIPDWKDK